MEYRKSLFVFILVCVYSNKVSETDGLKSLGTCSKSAINKSFTFSFRYDPILLYHCELWAQLTEYHICTQQCQNFAFAFISFVSFFLYSFKLCERATHVIKGVCFSDCFGCISVPYFYSVSHQASDSITVLYPYTGQNAIWTIK